MKKSFEKRYGNVNVHYKNPGFEYSIDSILLFQTDGSTPYWSDSLFYFYPRLERNIIRGLDEKEKRDYLINALSDAYIEAKNEIERKASAYNEHYTICRDQIDGALSDAFETDTSVLFNDLTANITMNPICPRFLKEHRFDIFYKNSEKGAVGVSIHEMIHYVWFYVWNNHFHDDYEEYENPSLKWILSEMVVESIMRDERLSSINPYFPGCVYSFFLDMAVDGEPILETIDRMYKSFDITHFMETAYDYCAEHEKEIRAHIEKSENKI